MISPQALRVVDLSSQGRRAISNIVEEAVQLALDLSRLRIVCPFAKGHLACPPELKGRYAVAAQASIADNESLSKGQTMVGA